MGPDLLSDPVVGLIDWLSKDENEGDFWLPGKVPRVTYYPQTPEASPIYEKSPLVVGIKSAGIGSGNGQLAMARYESMRIDAVASAHNDWEAYRLGKLMHRAILRVRGKTVGGADQGIEYTTRFVNIYQSGGPAPFQDAPGGNLNWRSVLYVYNVNFTTFKQYIKVDHALQNVMATATVEQS